MLRWRDIPLSGRLLLIASVSVIPFVVFVSIGLLQATQNDELQRWVTHTYEVKASAADLLRLSVDRETGARGYLLTRQAPFLEPLYSARSVFDRRLEELEKLVEDNPAQKKRLEKIRELSNELRDSRDQAIAQMEQGRAAEALQWVKSGEEKRRMDEIRVLAKAILDEEDRLLDTRVAAAQRWNKQVFWTRIFGGTGVVLFSILVSFIFAASLRRRLSQLEGGAKAIAGGHYEHRIPVRTGAELGTLASAMNTMAEAIMSRDTELQAQNEELQAQQTELEAANVELEAQQAEVEEAHRQLADSEAQLNHFFTLSLDMFCIAGFDGYFKRLNPVWQTTLGFTLQELQSKPYVEFIHPDDRQRTTIAAQELSRRGEIVNFENRYLCKNGSYKWFLWSASSSSEEQLHYAVAHDVTERKRLEEALQQKTDLIERERNQYQALMDSSADGLAMVDLHGKIIYMNATFAKTLGIEGRYDFFGKSVAEARGVVLPKVKDPEPYLRFMEKVWADPEASEEVLVEFQDGTTLRLRSGPVRDGYGRIVGRNLTFADQTKERAIDRMKSELVSTVSHELRTPLASLLGFSELLLQRDLSAQKQKTFLETIHKEAKRLTSLINDFLDLQRIEAGKFSYDILPVDLPSLLCTVEDVCAGQSTRHRFIIRCTEDLPQVMADPEALQQVLQNLLSNAVKYSPDGGEIFVEAEALPEERMVRISVRDHGLGIPEEALPKLFDKFFRVDSSDHRKIGGTGLGLSLCREILKALGGTINVKSELGKGSTFTFTLPVADKLVDQQQLIKPIEDTKAEAEYILVVEDDASFSELIREHLAIAGYAVKVTATAEQALGYIARKNPSLVLLDIRLVGAMDGWDLLVQLKRERATWNIPVIVTSVSENRKMGLALGVRDYLVKPFDMDRLLSVVQSVVGVGNGQSVLIVEDDDAFRSAMAESLKKIGFWVDEAANGAEVAGHLHQHRPSLLILDLQMPEMNGFQVLARLREQKETLTLPVLVVTGVSLSQSEREFIKRQMASLLPKNQYSPTALVETIQMLLSEPVGSVSAKIMGV